MPPIVVKLQNDAQNPEIAVVTLLLTAKSVATKLDLNDELIWINNELDGYIDVHVSDVPSYRYLRGEPKARDPYSGWIPIQIRDAEIMKLISDAPCKLALGAIEEMLRLPNPEGYLVFRYSPEMIEIINKIINEPMDVEKHVSRGQISHITDAVRNLVLDWSLELEKAGILGENSTFTGNEKVDAKSIPQIIINGNNAIVGDISGNAHISNTVTTGFDAKQVRDLIQQIDSLKGTLPNDLKETLIPIIDGINDALNLKPVDEKQVKSLLNSIKDVCKGATGSLVAQGIISTIASLI